MRFKYSVKDKDGVVKEGFIVADFLEDVVINFQKSGFTEIEVVPAEEIDNRVEENEKAKETVKEGSDNLEEKDKKKDFFILLKRHKMFAYITKKINEIKKERAEARIAEARIKEENKQKFNLKCSRCGYEGTGDTFEDAYSDFTCCLLACLLLLPAILYYFFRLGKKVCPKCKNIF